MKFVYQTKLEGSIPAPTLPENAIFAVKAAALCNEKVSINGAVVTNSTSEALSIVKKTGARFIARGASGNINVVPVINPETASEVIFREELTRIRDLTERENIFDGNEIKLPLLVTDKEIFAFVCTCIAKKKAMKVYLSAPVDDAVYASFCVLVLRELGANISFPDAVSIICPPEATLLGGNSLNVDGDWNIAAFGLMCSALGYNVKVSNIYDRFSVQPGSKIINPLCSMGLALDTISDEFKFVNNEFKHAIRVDAGECPELLPYILFMATQAEGISEIYNVTSEIVEMNNNAIYYTLCELKKLGAEFSSNGPGSITIKGKIVFDGGLKLDCRENFLVATTLILATLCCRKSNVLENCEALTEYCPDFWQKFSAMNGFAE